MMVIDVMNEAERQQLLEELIRAKLRTGGREARSQLVTFILTTKTEGQTSTSNHKEGTCQ
jgi:hypothetical protein